MPAIVRKKKTACALLYHLMLVPALDKELTYADGEKIFAVSFSENKTYFLQTFFPLMFITKGLSQQKFSKLIRQNYSLTILFFTLRIIHNHMPDWLHL